MEPESSLLCLNGPATGSYPEPDASNPHLPTLFLQDSLFISFSSNQNASSYTNVTLSPLNVAI